MSTIKVNKIENTATTDGGVAIDATGHVTVDGVQLPTAGALSNRNLIINGAMQVAQRGTSSTSGGYCSVDRIKGATSDTNTQSQESLSTSDTPYSYGFRNYYRLKNTTASSGGSTTYREIDYRVEAQDIASSGWNYTSTSSYITIQFWLRASVSQSYYLHVRSQDGTERSFISELAVTADTWKKFEITIPGNSGITLNNDNGHGLMIRFLPWYGTTYTGSGTLDAWTTTSNEVIPDMTDTWGETVNATFDITGLQLEVGEKATPFEHRSYGDELARCQRYYQKTSASSTAPFQRLLPFGHMVSSSAIRLVAELRPPMRAVPSFNQNGNIGTSPSVGTPGLSLETDASSERLVTLLDNTSISGTQGDCISIFANNHASAYVEFTAEL